MLLQEYKRKYKLTVEGLAHGLGVTPDCVYKYLSGDRKPKENVMLLIYKITNGLVTANDFYLPQKLTKRTKVKTLKK